LRTEVNNDNDISVTDFFLNSLLCDDHYWEHSSPRERNVA